MAFITALPLRNIFYCSSWPSSHNRRVCATAHASATPSACFNFKAFTTLLETAQQSLVSQIEAIDQKESFCSDRWTRDDSYGHTRVLQNGGIFEKAGVNVSSVSGILSESRAASMRTRGRIVEPGVRYDAAALSFVLHAQSPLVPTLRGDVRIFAADGQFWGGGGVDLTVFYVHPQQAARFHSFWKDVCDTFDVQYYPKFKRQCDEYFFIPSRGEYRGLGGLFYDDLVLPEHTLFEFQTAMLDNFLPSFAHILDENASLPWTQQQKHWQRIRRGRYLEFNLLNDRGVRFGLAGGRPSRTESIMISAPPSIEWPYGYSPEPGSPEHESICILTGQPIDWAAMSFD